MLTQGPLPLFLHGLLEYVEGALLIAAPFLFSYDDGRATAASVVIGLGLVALTATSDLPTALARSLSTGAHVTADVVVALLLVAAPFVLGFRGADGQATAVFIVLGVVHLLLMIATRFPGGDSPTRR